MLQISKNLKVRSEPWGSFVYFQKSQRIGRLNQMETVIAISFSKPRDAEQVIQLISLDLSVQATEVRTVIEKLVRQKVLTSAQSESIPLTRNDWKRVLFEQQRIREEKPFSAPVWMHIQPWTVCNLKCQHCYCFASPQGTPSHLSEDHWFELIDHFGNMNVFEMFITGGEVFLDEKFWTISRYARTKGLVIRTTTNGTLIKPETPARLVQELDIDKIQVSLDGASPDLHDTFRGRPGAFNRTIDGIKRLRKEMEVSLEVTMHQHNHHQVESFVSLASELGCTEVKFVNIFPTGRAFEVFDKYKLAEDQKNWLIEKYAELQNRYPDIHLNYGSNCNDVTQKDSAICTAGVIGANVNERGDVLPCIMGISVESLQAGNVLEQEFPDIWYHSPLLKRMRNLPDTPGASCASCLLNKECKSRCAVISHTAAQHACHLSPINPQSHFITVEGV